MLLNDLLSKLNFFTLNGKKDTSNIIIEDAFCDSRFVSKNSIFICLSGYTVDGHDYLDEAISKGAIAIVHEKQLSSYRDDIVYIQVTNTNRALSKVANHLLHFPSLALKMIGVTGTNGKTTTTNLIDHILTENRKNVGLIGTIKTKYADVSFESTNTTPNSLDLQKTLHNMSNADVEYVAMEVSSHALLLGRTWGTEFDTAVFTNLSQDHLDFHKDMTEYATAKSLLFSRLNFSKNAIINIDDAMAEFFIEKTEANIITYGIDNKSDFQALDVQLSPKGTSFTLSLPNGVKVPFKTKLIGKFNVYNTLAAIAVADSYNIPLAHIQSAFLTINGVDGRFESVEAGQDFSVIVDYAHTPDSLENVLDTARELTKGRVITIVGCGGDRDKTKRPIMAKIAQEKSDFSVYTSDNPRTEDPQSILNDLIDGIDQTKNNYTSILERDTAIHHAINNVFELTSDDTVIIVGKGHETYQIIGREKIHFDDREHAKEAILSRNNISI